MGWASPFGTDPSCASQMPPKKIAKHTTASLTSWQQSSLSVAPAVVPHSFCILSNPGKQICNWVPRLAYGKLPLPMRWKGAVKAAIHPLKRLDKAAVDFVHISALRKGLKCGRPCMYYTHIRPMWHTCIMAFFPVQVHAYEKNT